MGEVHRLPAPQVSFSLQTAGPLMTKIFPQWVQDLALLVERRNRAASGSVARLAAGRDCAATLFQKTLPRRRGGLHAGAHGTGRHGDGAGLFGRVERLPADDADRPDYAFPCGR